MAFRENYSWEMHFLEGKLFPSAGIGKIRYGHRVPCGHEQNMPTMPDEEEDDDEDEGNVTGDEDDGGYSMRVCRLCQW